MITLDLGNEKTNFFKCHLKPGGTFRPYPKPNCLNNFTNISSDHPPTYKKSTFNNSSNNQNFRCLLSNNIYIAAVITLEKSKSSIVAHQVFRSKVGIHGKYVLLTTVNTD